MRLVGEQMKSIIYILVLFSLAYLSSCQKDALAPVLKSNTDSTKSVTSTTTSINTGSAAATDTVMNVNGFIKIKLAKDTFNTDGIMILFKPKSTALYVPSEDAPYFQGFGLVSISGLSSDNIALALDVLPLTEKGTCVRLNVTAKEDAAYKISLQAIQSIPSKYHVWLMDGYKKDSCDLRVNRSYLFNINTSDTTTFGKNRFKLIVR